MKDKKSIRICKISFSFPSVDSPGAGLTVFKPSCFIEEPTLYITPTFKKSAIVIPPHIHIKKINLITLPIWQHLPSNNILKRICQFIFLSEYSVRMLIPTIRFHPDILVVGLSTFIPSIFIKKICNCKLALSLHNVTDVEIILHNKYLKWLAKKTDLILVVSKNMKRMLKDAIRNDKISVRPTGVDLDDFYTKSIPFEYRKKQIITVGSFKWKKGYKYLIEAMKEVNKSYPEYLLVIVGTGAGEKEIKNLILENSLQNKVKILKQLQQKEINKLLNESRLFVLASLREGLPKALIESLACGTPAVVTTACNSGEFIKEVGLEVPAKDVISLSDAIQFLLREKSLWKKNSSKASCIAKQYSWKNVSLIEKASLQKTVALK